MHKLSWKQSKNNNSLLFSTIFDGYILTKKDETNLFLLSWSVCGKWQSEEIILNSLEEIYLRSEIKKTLLRHEQGKHNLKNSGSFFSFLSKKNNN